MSRASRFLLPPLVALTLVTGFAHYRWTRAGLGVGGTRNERKPQPGAARFLKGQLHLHTRNSGDGHQSPDEVMRWYEARGYDFIVFTDHNFITLDSLPAGQLLAMPGVELTANLDTCLPAPPPGLTCNLHVNALFVDPARTSASAAAARSAQRLDVYAHGLEQAAALGAIAQINHPNFRYGADGALLTELARSGSRPPTERCPSKSPTPPSSASSEMVVACWPRRSGARPASNSRDHSPTMCAPS